MPGFTPYWIDHVLDHCLRGVAWTPPAGLYAELHILDPGPDGSAGVSATTTRKAITLTAAANGSVQIAQDVTWALVAPDSIGWFAIFDSPTPGTGNCVFTDSVEEVKNFYAGDNATLTAGTTLTIPAAA